jgi:hypothetical protein
MEPAPEYTFRNDAYTPDTFPMWRLAVYMRDPAGLLGEREHVHFVRLEPGSTVLVQRVGVESAPKVQGRVRSIKPAEGEGPEDALRAFKAIDSRLDEDNALGHLCGRDGAEIIRFPGREKPQPLTFGAFRQPGSLDGVLIKLGGKDKTVPVHLRDEGVSTSATPPARWPRRLAPHLFESTPRVHGTGRWERDAEGAWSLKRFDIESFEILDDAPLGRVVERLRQIPRSGWKELGDPYAERQHLRQRLGEVH